MDKQWIKEKIKKDIKNFLEANEDENTIQQNLCNTLKAVLHGKFIVPNVYNKKKFKNHRIQGFNDITQKYGRIRANQIQAQVTVIKHKNQRRN